MNKSHLNTFLSFYNKFKIFLIIFFIFSINLLYGQDNNYTTSIPAINLNVIGKTKNSLNNPNYFNKNSIIISRENIMENNYESVYDALEHTSGITIGRSFKDVIDIRGQGEAARQRVKVLFNDIPLNMLDNTHYFPGYNIFKSQSVEKILVIPGGSSVLYGNGTQGGVVNILTNFRDMNSKAVNFVYAGLASYNTHRFGASLGKNSLNDKFFLQLDYNGETNKAYLRKEYAINHYYSFSTKMKLTDNQQLGYSFSYYIEDGLFSGVVSKYKLKNDFRASGILYPRNRKQNFHLASYQANFLDNTIVVDNLLFYNYGNFSQTNKGKFYTNVMGDKLKTNIHYGSQASSLLLGSDIVVTKQKIQPIKGNPFIYEKDSLAPYAFNKVYYHKWFSTQGARLTYDHWVRTSPKGANTNLYGNTTTTFYKDILTNSLNLGLGLDYTKTASIWATLETGSNPPDASHLTNKVKGLYVPACDLKYENYYTLESGIEQTIPFSQTYLRGVIFYTYTHNKITRTASDGLLNIFSINMGNTSRKGIELTGEQYLYKDILSLSLGFTSVDARFEKYNAKAFKDLENNKYLSPSDIEKLKEELKFKEGKKLDKVPKYTLNSTIKLKVLSNINFAANFNYISSHIANFLEYYTEKEINQVQGKVITNLSVSYNNNKVYMSVGVNNVSNAKYFILSSEGGNKTGVVRPAMGRNYFFDIRYQI